MTPTEKKLVDALRAIERDARENVSAYPSEDTGVTLRRIMDVAQDAIMEVLV